jgi:hypothetical protein
MALVAVEASSNSTRASLRATHETAIVVATPASANTPATLEDATKLAALAAALCTASGAGADVVAEAVRASVGIDMLFIVCPTTAIVKTADESSKTPIFGRVSHSGNSVAAGAVFCKRAACIQWHRETEGGRERERGGGLQIRAVACTRSAAVG